MPFLHARWEGVPYYCLVLRSRLDEEYDSGQNKSRAHYFSPSALPQTVILFLEEKNQVWATRVMEALHMKHSGEWKSTSTKIIHEPMCTHMHTLWVCTKAKSVWVASSEEISKQKFQDNLTAFSQSSSQLLLSLCRENFMLPRNLQVSS